MRQHWGIILTGSWLAFVVSTLIFALMPPSVHHHSLSTLALDDMSHGYMGQITDLIFRSYTALWLLLACCWVSLARHVWQVTDMSRRINLAQEHAQPGEDVSKNAPRPPTQDQMLRTHGDGPRRREHILLILALIGAATVPWLSVERPKLAVIVAILTMAAAILTLICGQRNGSYIVRRGGTGLFGGWLSVTALTLFAAFLSDHFGAPFAATLAMAITVLIAVTLAVQLWIHGSIGFSVAAIWALIGLTTNMIAASPAIATLALAGIAAIVLVLVMEMS